MNFLIYLLLKGAVLTNENDGLNKYIRMVAQKLGIGKEGKEIKGVSYGFLSVSHIVLYRKMERYVCIVIKVICRDC